MSIVEDYQVPGMFTLWGASVMLNVFLLVSFFKGCVDSDIVKSQCTAQGMKITYMCEPIKGLEK